MVLGFPREGNCPLLQIYGDRLPPGHVLAPVLLHLLNFFPLV